MPDTKPVLSPRQRKIAVLVGREGLTFPKIADILGISPRTVEAHARAAVTRNGIDRSPRDALHMLYWCHIHGEEDAA